MEWEKIITVRVAPVNMQELEKEVDREAIGFLGKASLQKAFNDDGLDLDGLEKVWSDEARAAAAEARTKRDQGFPRHNEGEHYVKVGPKQDQMDFAGYLNAKVGIAEGKARAYEKKAASSKGKEQRQFLHISNSYKATAGKLAVSRASFVGVSRMGDVGLK